MKCVQEKINVKDDVVKALKFKLSKVRFIVASAWIGISG